jgi:hypothetical protein
VTANASLPRAAAPLPEATYYDTYDPTFSHARVQGCVDIQPRRRTAYHLLDLTH